MSGKTIAALGVIAVVAAYAPEASARVIIGGGVIVGEPYYAYPPYYSYPYYSYAPAPEYYAPPAAPPQYVPPPNGDSGAYCREYTRPVVVGGHTQQAYGHACRQPDGSWKIID